MRTIYAVFVTTVAVLVLLAGCYKMAIYKNQKNLMKLEKGMTREAVMRVMGNPDDREVYQSLYGNTMVILYYYTQRKGFDGKVTRDECTPVVIKNEKLIGWGDGFYQWIQRREKKVNHR